MPRNSGQTAIEIMRLVLAAEAAPVTRDARSIRCSTTRL